MRILKILFFPKSLTIKDQREMARYVVNELGVTDIINNCINNVLSQAQKKGRVFQEGAKQEGFVLQRAAVTAGGGGEGIRLRERQVGQRVRLEPAPEVLHGVELGGIGREEESPHPGPLPQEGLHPSRAVRQEPIPDEHDGSVEVSVEVAEEAGHPMSRDVGVGMEAEEQMHPIPPGVHAKGRDDRHLLVRARPLHEEGCLAPGAPAAPQPGGHQEAALVQEDQPGPQRGRFFLTRGHSSLTQRWMRASSRSAARRWGRCGVQPSARRSRPIWSTW